MEDIVLAWPIDGEEYSVLDEKFGDLCEYAAWQLYKKNSKNNHTDEQRDVSQELRYASIVAGSYYKRQIYIEQCLESCEKHAKDKMIALVVDSLKSLWKNKTRHGANRQKFGPKQEKLLDKLIKKIVPKSERPVKNQPLKIDGKFATYCKAIIWNRQRALGKKITREKSIRTGLASLSEFDYLGNTNMVRSIVA